MGDEVVGADVSRKAMGCSKELQSRPVIGRGKVVGGWSCPLLEGTRVLVSSRARRSPGGEQG